MPDIEFLESFLTCPTAFQHLYSNISVLLMILHNIFFYGLFDLFNCLESNSHDSVQLKQRIDASFTLLFDTGLVVFDGESPVLVCSGVYQELPNEACIDLQEARGRPLHVPGELPKA